MDAYSLHQLAVEQIETARHATSGRAARTLHGGHDAALRQTVLAFTAGHGLGDHEAPGEATLQVLTGRVRLITATDSWEGEAGDHLAIPTARHSVEAVEDSAVLLTVAISDIAGAATTSERGSSHE